MIAFLLTVVLQVATPRTDATIVGTVRDGESGRPLVGATVIAVEAGRQSTSNAEGRYAIARLSAGPQHIAVRSIGHAPYALHAMVPRHGTLELNVALQPLPTRLPIVEVRRHRGEIDHSPGALQHSDSRTISAAELTRHPQLSEPDFLRAVVGGDVVVAAETPGGLHIRGGSTDQTGYSIDGVPVFNPYHTSDLMGGWNTDAFDGARLSSNVGGLSVLSGTLQLTSRSPGAQLQHRGGASTTHARFTIDGPLGVRQTGFLVSARAAWPALLAPDNDPHFIRGKSGDWLAKLESPWSGGTLRMFLTQSVDGVNLSPVPTVASGSESLERRNSFDWSSATAALQWQGRMGRDSVGISGWRSATGASGSWGVRPLALTSRRTDYGVQATVSRGGADAASRAGLRLEHSRMTYRVEDQGSDASHLRTATPILTAFADAERAIGTSFAVGGGAAAVLYGGRGYLSPRLQGRWRVTDHLAITGVLARSRQFAQSLRNTESAVGYVFPADLPIGAGPGAVPVAHSDELSVAADYEPAAGVRTRLYAYAREMSGVVLVAPFEDGPFLRGRPSSGSANARGAYAEAQVRAARYVLLARYGVQRVRFHQAATSYIPSFGARALVDGGLTTFPTPTTSLRLGVTAALGRYVTPASGNIEWESCNLKDRGCEFAGSPRADPSLTGALQAPDYVRVDIGVRKHGHLRLGSRSAEVAIFGTYSNLLNRFNVLTYGVVNGVTQAVEMRPQAPLVVGLDWRF